MKQEQSNRGRWTVIIIVLISLMIISSIFAAIYASFSGIDGYESGNALIIPIRGAITTEKESGLFGGGTGSTDIVNLIDEAERDESITAVIFEIDSPGGAPVASHEIVKRIKQMTKPKIAVIREAGASGAYWVASATDRIFADELSITGSIGVLSSYINFNEFLDDHNITYERLVGGEFKDLGTPLKPLTPDERVELQTKINIMHEYFLDDVAASRNLTREQRAIVQSGIFYTGLEAMDLGLIDEFGSFREAESYLSNVTGIAIDAKRLPERKGLFEALSSLSYGNGYNFAEGFKQSFAADRELRLE